MLGSCQGANRPFTAAIFTAVCTCRLHPPPARRGVGGEGQHYACLLKLDPIQRAASQFDLLYLYGFVSLHPAHDTVDIEVRGAAG